VTGEVPAVIFSGVGTGLLAAVVAVLGYRHQQLAARKLARSTMYAEALRAVLDYLEGPYRVRRHDGTPETRRFITDSLSEVQSRIAFHSSWLDIDAPTAVAEAYRALVTAARNEADAQMTAAWALPALVRDDQVPLGTRYEQPLSDAALLIVKEVMRKHG